MRNPRMPRRWPLLLVAPASCVAVWTGWVGLGEMAGFGPVQPLPGISGWTINSAITLPIGVEAYAAFALNAWLSRAPLSGSTRKFAKRSAIGSLILGASGQAIYHLLVAAGRDTAPWPVTVLVSCLPVLVLGMAAALAHMLRADADNLTDSRDSEDSAAAEPAPQQATPHGQPTVEVADPAPVELTQPAVSGHTDTSGDSEDNADSYDAKLHEARQIVDEWAADGQYVSRAMLKTAGIRGSNRELSQIAKRLNTERAEQTAPAA